jgi:hypothetical protein
LNTHAILLRGFSGAVAEIEEEDYSPNIDEEGIIK